MLTWEDLRRRSVQRWFGETTFCGACWVAYREARRPCRVHATAEELLDMIAEAEVAAAYQALA